MPMRNPLTFPSHRILHVCIASLLATSDLAFATSAVAESTPGSTTTHAVTNCEDDGPGSLRDEISRAVSGDSVNLLGLTCSVITLTSGELHVDVDTLFIAGYGATVEVQNGGRAINHQGTGRLGITMLTITGGYLNTASPALGGCIYSAGDVYLGGATITNCTVAPKPGEATVGRGGGVYARNHLDITHSTISGNTLRPPDRQPYSTALGAGVFGRYGIEVSASTISGNAIESECRVVPSECTGFYGAGLASLGGVYVSYSAIYDNQAYSAPAAFFGGGSTTSHIVNSTISGNSALIGSGAIQSSDGLLEIRSSTIAFNEGRTGYAGGSEQGGGICALGLSEYLVLHNSIIANNVSRGGVPDDIRIDRPYSVILGAGNLVLASDKALPPDTIQADPLLAPLGSNGGSTPTHALQTNSPAIDAGVDYRESQYDQRGSPFFRVSGTRIDIGAFEVQQQPPADLIFVDGFD